jgi:hypothetical protein
MPEIITSLLNIPIMEHSDIVFKVNLYKHIYDTNDNEELLNIDNELNKLFYNNETKKFETIEKENINKKKSLKDEIMTSYMNRSLSSHTKNKSKFCDF